MAKAKELEKVHRRLHTLLRKTELWSTYNLSPLEHQDSNEILARMSGELQDLEAAVDNFNEIVGLEIE